MQLDCSEEMRPIYQEGDIAPKWTESAALEQHDGKQQRTIVMESPTLEIVEQQIQYYDDNGQLREGQDDDLEAYPTNSDINTRD